MRNMHRSDVSINRLHRRPAPGDPGAMDALVDPSVDLVEWYYAQGFSDGLPVVPPTPEKLVSDAPGARRRARPGRVPRPAAMGRPDARVLAINLVMAGCTPAYAPVVRAAMLALTAPAFNLNGVQATTHMAAPLLVVNGPIARDDRHERRRQLLRLRQPRQRHDRPGHPPGPAERRRRLAGRSRQGDPRPPRQVHLLHRRERGREPVRALPCREGLRRRATPRSS